MTSVASLSIGFPQVASVTLCLILVTTLCFLPLPSRATLLWVFAFAASMLGMYALVIAVGAGNEILRRAALGASLCSLSLIWSGVRSWCGRRPLTAIPVLFVLVSTSMLAVIPDDGYDLAFGVVFCVVGVFAGLGGWELRRSAERRLPAVVAFQLSSGLLAALGVAVLIIGVTAHEAIGDGETVRSLNGIAVVVYAFCAVVGMAAMVQNASPAPNTPTDRFPATLRERLARARERGERDWTMLAVHLDDLAELRAVHGPGEYRHLIDEFERVVAGALPASADIGVVSEGRLLVLIDRAEAVIRSHVRVLLDDVEEVAASEHVAALSASVGWVPAAVADYDASALRARATEAAARAAAAGGDRWYRVRPAAGHDDRG